MALVAAAALIVLAALRTSLAAAGIQRGVRRPKRGLVRRQGLDLGWKEEDALLRRDALHQKHTRGILI